MAVTRRDFVRFTAAAVATTWSARAAGSLQPATSRRRPRAVAFDAFPIFNPAPVVARANELFPERGVALCDEWRLRQFEYGWLRVLSRRYVDFWQVTNDALTFAAQKLQLKLDSRQHDALMTAFLELAPWPDVGPALDSLERLGLRLAFLSNFTTQMLEANLERSGLRSRFDHLLSTDQAKTFKPDPRAYELATRAYSLPREEILFVAHAGWDAAGATAFGYPTFWVNRQGLPAEELGATPSGVGRDLSELVRFMGPSGR